MIILHRFTCWLVRVGTRLICRIQGQDLAQIPQKGPLLLVTNHIGSLEVPLLFAHLQPRPITGFAKSETWDDPLMGWLFDLWGAIPIRRGEADMEALRRGFKALSSGYILAVAPEGTRSRHGRLLRGHPGIVTLALHSGATIIPLAHWGSENLSSNIKQLKRTDFHIRVGRSFRLDANNEKITHALRQQMTDEIMVQIAQLLPEVYRGEYEQVVGMQPKYLLYQ